MIESPLVRVWKGAGRNEGKIEGRVENKVERLVRVVNSRRWTAGSMSR